MKNFLALEAGPPKQKTLNVVYYALQIISISACIAFLLDGITDPFGELTIILSIAALILIPACLRIIFGVILLLKKKSN